MTYPQDWPRCQCGDFALDGHVTCGRVECNESNARQIKQAFEQREADRIASQLRPYCQRCGWRKGGPDSWDGLACKCGDSVPAIRRIE